MSRTQYDFAGISVTVGKGDGAYQVRGLLFATFCCLPQLLPVLLVPALRQRRAREGCKQQADNANGPLLHSPLPPRALGKQQLPLAPGSKGSAHDEPTSKAPPFPSCAGGCPVGQAPARDAPALGVRGLEAAAQLGAAARHSACWRHGGAVALPAGAVRPSHHPGGACFQPSPVRLSFCGVDLVGPAYAGHHAASQVPPSAAVQAGSVTVCFEACSCEQLCLSPSLQLRLRLRLQHNYCNPALPMQKVAPEKLVFVLKDGQQWLNNGGGDFMVDLKASSAGGASAAKYRGSASKGSASTGSSRDSTPSCQICVWAQARVNLYGSICLLEVLRQASARGRPHLTWCTSFPVYG